MDRQAARTRGSTNQPSGKLTLRATSEWSQRKSTAAVRSSASRRSELDSTSPAPSRVLLRTTRCLCSSTSAPTPNGTVSRNFPARASRSRFRQRRSAARSAEGSRARVPRSDAGNPPGAGGQRHRPGVGGGRPASPGIRLRRREVRWRPAQRARAPCRSGPRRRPLQARGTASEAELRAGEEDRRPSTPCPPSP